MKTRNLLLILMILCAMISGCTSEGLTGPEGPAGTQGPQGAQGEAGSVGPIGSAGKDGSIIYSGAGTPPAASGNAGDYYLDRSTGNLYGPKVAAGWGTPLLLMGVKGAAGTNGTNGVNGAAGSKTFSGTTIPAVTLGSTGDYYLDKTSYLLYGPKTNAGWGIPILLRGATGAQGPSGVAGKDGSIIYSGSGVPVSTIGIIGDYYLNRSNGNLYGPKTAIGWGTPITLMGAAGKDGTNGTNGTEGTAGTNGSTTWSGLGAPLTAAGAIGDYYLDKTNYLLYGPKASNGWGSPLLLRGAAGVQGPAGASGKDGSVIYSGTGTPATIIGLAGDYYLDKNTGNLYGPKTAADWGTPLTLKGSNGANGTAGTNGTDGADGSNGVNGSTTFSGFDLPAPALGAVGDYYLNKTNYLLYGPKTLNGWGIPILLRGADGAQGPTGPAGADGSVIYSGDNAPAVNLGKVGDYYFARLAVAMFGPKTVGGWGTGLALKGANGTNGSNGTNGASVLSGVGLPAGTTGNDGDFYLDVSTYTLYGPKAAGVWGSTGTSLKGQNGADGNANVIALETPDQVTFSWALQYGDYFLRKQGASANDTTTVYNIPAANISAVGKGIVMVYIRRAYGAPGTYNWQQLNYTQATSMGFSLVYTYSLTVNASSAFIRISYKDPNVTHNAFVVDKVRIVIVPQSSSAVLNSNNKHVPMLQTLQKLHLQEKDFQKLH